MIIVIDGTVLPLPPNPGGAWTKTDLEFLKRVLRKNDTRGDSGSAST